MFTSKVMIDHDEDIKGKPARRYNSKTWGKLVENHSFLFTGEPLRNFFSIYLSLTVCDVHDKSSNTLIINYQINFFWGAAAWYKKINILFPVIQVMFFSLTFNFCKTGRKFNESIKFTKIQKIPFLNYSNFENAKYMCIV